jgi:hypothetical protein
MAPRRAFQARLSMFVGAVILLACAATGLVAGSFAHTLARASDGASATVAPVISGSPPAAAATATSNPTDTATVLPPNTQSGFILDISVSARTLSAGQTITITVNATTHGVPVVGLLCSLRSPVSGPPGLLSSWPAAVTSDAAGRAQWTVTVPSVAPATYGIEAYAVGSHHYAFHRYATVVVV